MWNKLIDNAEKHGISFDARNAKDLAKIIKVPRGECTYIHQFIYSYVIHRDT
jgi:hypothetical protein